jgi:hypothetical protein
MSIPTIHDDDGSESDDEAVIAMTAWHACQILRVMTMIMMTDRGDNEGSDSNNREARMRDTTEVTKVKAR